MSLITRLRRVVLRQMRPQVVLRPKVTNAIYVHMYIRIPFKKVESNFFGYAGNESQSFIAMAAFCSTWLPCVVGDHPKIFLVSGVTSLASKVLLLIVALTFAETG